MSKLPKSATSPLVASSGTVAFIAAVFLARCLAPFDDVALVALAVMAITACGFAVPYLLTVPDWRGFDRGFACWREIRLRCLGVAASVGFVGVLYWLLPEYHGSFYAPYFSALRYLLPAWALLCVPYLYWRQRVDPVVDGYYRLGALLSGDVEQVDWPDIVQHLLAWVVKGFFLPLMFVALCDDLRRFVYLDFAYLTTFDQWFDVLLSGLYMVDVGVVCVGYVLALRALDTHVRSVEPTLFGWVVALVCYQPFWSLFGRLYLSYGNGLSWSTWLRAYPVVSLVWGCSILALTAVYVWATVCFGLRFSNLTHRGLISIGPYRYFKHPAYLSKNLSWWLISVPWVVQTTGLEALRHCLLLAGVNLVYWLRAKTEEAHLSADPAFAQYFRCFAPDAQPQGGRGRPKAALYLS